LPLAFAQWVTPSLASSVFSFQCSSQFQLFTNSLVPVVLHRRLTSLDYYFTEDDIFSNFLEHLAGVVVALVIRLGLALAKNDKRPQAQNSPQNTKSKPRKID
jgi:hypothetical protein